MKRYLSVFGLAARSSFWKGLAVIVVSVALAGVLLYFTTGSTTVHYYDEVGRGQTYEDDLALSELPKASKMAAPLALGLGGLCFLLARSGGGKGARTGYTMRRLQVREGTVRLLWVVYDFMMLLLLWALAALVAFGVMTLRAKGMSETHAIGPQSLILAYYGSALLHNLLPAGDALAWVSHTVALAACAVGCVDVAVKGWREKLGGIALGIAVILTAAGWCVDVQNSGYHIMLTVAQAVVIGLTIYSWKEGDEDEEFLDAGQN